MDHGTRIYAESEDGGEGAQGSQEIRFRPAALLR